MGTSLPQRLRSVAVGTATSIVLAIVLALIGGYGFPAYLAPGVAIGGLISPVLPAWFVYWLVPEGGGLAFLLLAFGASVVVWTAAAGSLHFWWSRRTSRSPRRPS
jgi:hypothetical protein